MITDRTAPCWSAPRHGQARSAVAVVDVEIDAPSLTSAPVVDTAAPFRDREKPRRRSKRARSERCSTQRRAVLDEGVVSVQEQLRSAARLVICPLSNSIALSPAS